MEGDHFVPEFVGNIFCGAVLIAVACVVYQNVDAAPDVKNLLYGGIDAFGICHVSGHRQAFPAFGPDFRSLFLQNIHAAGKNGDLCPLLCKQLRGGQADAGTGAGDQGNLIL